MTAIVEARGLNKHFRSGEIDIHVLRDLHLSVEAGEIVAVVGRSGSGKSTLLNVLGLLETPDSGTLSLGSASVDPKLGRSSNEWRSRQIGYVFQQFHLVPHLNALENVLLSLAYSHNEPRTHEGLGREALERVGLSHRLGAFPQTLSGGEQQRLAIARAIAKEPLLLLCDEPTGNLDRQTASEVLSQIVATRPSRGCVIIVTHDSHTAAAADRVLEMRDGALVEYRP